MDLATNPAAIRQFGKGLTQFQPDNVYLSKAKGRVSPFGAKVVLKWDYDESGRPVQKEVIEAEDESTVGTGSNFMGRMFRNSDKYANRMQKRADKAYEKYFGHAPGEDETSLATSGRGPAFGLPEPPLSEEQKRYMRESLTLPERTSTEDVNTSTVGAFGPLENVGPRNEEYAYGGMSKAKAGKLVMKERFTPEWSTVGQAISPTMDMVSSLLEQKDLNDLENRIYTPDVYLGSIPFDQMGSMGTWGKGPLTGKMMPNRKPQNEGIATYQNTPGFELSSQIPYQMGNRKYGGSYQQGGGVTPGQFYNYALQEKKYFLDNPDTWKEDPEMQNPDGSFNLCLDCLNVDYNDPATVQDVVRLINEGHSQYPHHSADLLNASLQKFGITPPTFGSAMQKKYGGSYQVGGTYYLEDDEIEEIFKNGGQIQYY